MLDTIRIVKMDFSQEQEGYESSGTAVKKIEIATKNPKKAAKSGKLDTKKFSIFGNVETNKKCKEIDVKEEEMDFKAELKSWKQKQTIGSSFSETEEEVEVPGEWCLIAAGNEILPEPFKARTLIQYLHINHADYKREHSSGEIWYYIASGNVKDIFRLPNLMEGQVLENSAVYFVSNVIQSLKLLRNKWFEKAKLAERSK